MRELHPLLIGNDALADPKSLRAILADHGYLFLKNVAPREPILALRRDILNLCRNAGWIAAGARDLDATWSGAGPFTEGDPAYMDVYKQVIHLDSFKALPEDPAIIGVMEKVID